MATLGEYFESEARDRLAELDRRLHRLPTPDAAELYRNARALRGAAQIAREGRIYRAASVLEAALKAVAAGDISWTDTVAAHARATVEDLQSILGRHGDDDQLDTRVDQTIHRWSGTGVRMPPQVTGTGSEEGGAGGASREFREFAAREVAAIADALDNALQQLAESPMDREPLRTILQRQRALLGAARLDELPVVAEILRAVEDLSGVIARLDIAVKREWLDVFRVARDGLRSAIQPLQLEQDPPATHSLSRLRHIREELLDRYAMAAAEASADQGNPARPLPFEFSTSSPAAPATPAAPAREAPAPVSTPAPAERPARTPAEPFAPADAPAPAHGETAAPAAAAPWTAGPPPDPVPAAVAFPDPDSMAVPVLEAVPEQGEEIMDLGPESIVTPGPDAAEGWHAEDVVSIDDLTYSREAALQRALQLRDEILDSQPLDPRAREAASEVFDLIRMALG